MENPKKHAPDERENTQQAPKKSIADRLIDGALKTGSGMVSLLSGLLATVLILYSGYVLVDTFHTQQQASSSARDLLQFKPTIIEDSAAPLYSPQLAEINDDYRAWLTVFDTGIDYPVMQGPNDLYYASHDIYKNTSLTGAIYLAAGNSVDFSDSYNLIYGHHMDNGAMFGGLDSFIDEAYFNAHRAGMVVTPDGVFDVEFFAVISTDAYETRVYSVGNRAGDVLAFLESGGAGGVGVGTTVLQYDQDAAEGAGKLLALSTCADAETSGRLVVIGKMTKRIPTIDVTVKKVWDDHEDQDGLRPAALTVTLSDGQTAVLTPENDWTATIAGVPQYNDAGDIIYTWTEEDVPGYTLVNYETEDGVTTLTNRHVPATAGLTVIKRWQDDEDRDGLRPDSLTVTLSNGTAVTLSDENQWTATVEDLPVYAQGQKINYTWTEEAVDGYTAESAVAGTVTTLTNTHVPAVVELTVSKVWDDSNDQDGIRPERVTVSLQGNGALVGTVTLSEENGWRAGIDELPAYENGRAIAYAWAEPAVEGYTLSASTEEGHTTLTNTHIPATTSLTVKKVWDDNENQDGVRPAQLMVALSSGAWVTLNPENGWSGTVDGLPVYADGQKIDYIWTEEYLQEYELTSSVTTGTVTVLTNRHETGTTVATVTKVWNDGDDQDGIRPQQITATLSNGTAVTLNEENQWTATVTGLPAFANGQEIAYTWTEEPVPGYTQALAVNGTTTTLTNTHVPETTALTVVKVWDDHEDQDGIRPDSLTVTLSNGTAVTLNEENQWTATVEDLPVYAHGEKIAYAWTEQAVAGYTAESAVAGTVTTLTNTHVPETTALTVTKAWDDHEDQDGIRPDSLRVYLSNGMAVELTAQEDWTATVEDLPVYNAGAPIAYAWAEEAVTGYEQVSNVTIGAVTTLTNRHEPETCTLTVMKTWADDDDRDGLRPASLTVTLSADGEQVAAVTLGPSNDWSGAVERLPVYARGEKIDYVWAEAPMTGYTLSAETEGTATILTNTHVPAAVSLTVTKVWEDEDDRDALRPAELTVTLLADGEAVDTVTLNAENQWTAVRADLPVYQHGGQAISYTWSEPQVAGYTGRMETHDNVTTLTNAHTPAATARTIAKVWNDGEDQDGLRPAELQVILRADGEDAATVTLNAENDWTQTITDLPVYAGGETIHYTWHENGAEGYLRTNTSVNGSVTTLTNTHVPATTARTVRKVWADQENVAGMRPDSVTAYLLANGERVESVILNEENQWTATLEKLPVSQAGQPIAYTWAEEPVDGYVLTVEDQADATVLTNTYDPEITSVTVTKVWDDSDDQDALRPDAITVNLLADGTQIATAEIKGDGNTWTYTFENLPKHADGKEIEYTVTEAEVAGYTAQIDGFTITNTHPAAQPVPPQPVSVTVTKVWNDGSNQDGLRPGSVTVRLLADGKEVASHAVTGTGDTWTYTFTGLDRMNGEREIVYTVTEDAVPGYSTSVNGYTVTNTHEPELISIRGSKVWKDNNNQQHMRPANVVIQLLADGQAIASQTISGSGNRWYFTFKDLPRYAQGRAIRYTVAEIEVEGYTTQIEGYTVTNTLKQPYTLTVYYQYLDGTTAAPTFFEINEEGDLYDIISPVIPGYKATLLRISGTQPARNIEFVVIYIPTTTPYDPTDPVDPINPPHGPVIIEDYETPLGLGEVNLNAGDCYE